MTDRLRVVLDTNVVVSALLWQGKPGDVLGKAEEGAIDLFTSEQLLAELTAVLERPKLAQRVQMTGAGVAVLVQRFRYATITVDPAPVPRRFSRDPDDDHVIACAVAAAADMIVTGDEDLLVLRGVQSVRIGTVAELLSELA